MLPPEDGYYWVKLNEASPCQVVQVISWRDFPAMIYFTRSRGLTAEKFAEEYPAAAWSDKIAPPPL